ncbi:MAG: glycosyltransferase [Micromonosporaceae bacterium]|nr:glycosyltransferase [Micromonosporaceae bacterium]
MTLASVPVSRQPISKLEGIVGEYRWRRLLHTAHDFREHFKDRVIWNVSSTATGGGVAEMLRTLVGYVQDLEIDSRWSVISGEPEFFRVTKRLHNRIHGQPGDTGALGIGEDTIYREVALTNAAALSSRISPGDLVILHDPQTAGLTSPLQRLGARVLWRCHIGTEQRNGYTREAWQFLRPHLASAEGFIFSRRQYVPDWVDPAKVWIIPPSIDPFSVKNQDLDEATVVAILHRIGVLAEPGMGAGPDRAATGAGRDAGRGAGAGSGTVAAPRFTRRDGSQGEVVRPALVTAHRLPHPGEQVVVQVSRWDRLKDMAGVMRGFTEHVAPASPGYLMLVGPAVSGVADDPEGAEVYADCLDSWRRLPRSAVERVALVTLPLEDVDENAAMVNAIQRYASVLVQKSLAEGFGLTVAEGMWKRRPVVGAAVGGIRDQLAEGSGILLPDPTDLAAFGRAVRHLLDNPELAERLGTSAREYVRAHFVGDVHLIRYAQMFTALFV